MNKRMNRQKPPPIKDRHPSMAGLTQEAQSFQKNNRKTKQGKAERLITLLEQELARTREELRAATEQQATTGEELQSFNEELQAANEQLVTRTEQLQSSNDELV